MAISRFQTFLGASIKRAIIAPSILIILSFAVAAQIALTIIYVEQKSTVQASERSFELLALSEGVPALFATIQGDLYRLSVMGSVGQTGKELADTQARIEATFSRLEHDLDQLADEVNPILIELGREYQAAVTQARTLIERSPLIGSTATRGVEPLYEKIEEIAQQNAIQIKEDTMAQFEIMQRNWLWFVVATVVCTVVLTSVLLHFAIVSSRMITTPILTLATTVERLAKGDLEGEVEGVGRDDELGIVARSVESFRLSLQRVFSLQKERNALNESLKEKIKQLGEQSDQMRRNAYHDALTGLPNRRYLNEKLHEFANAESDSAPHSIAFLHIDLDRFKEINDTLGHTAGDHVLHNAANCLKAFAGESEFVARLGGDEFAMIIATSLSQTFDERQRVCDIAEALVLAMSQPLELDGALIRHGASVGIAFAACEREALHQVMINSDLALYAAKEAGRNRYHVYSPELQSAMVSRKKLSDDIHHGLEHNEFVPFFQAKVCANTLELRGVEVLARWQHPTDGLKTPGSFLELAEEIGVMAEIDQKISTQAIEVCERFVSQGLPIDHVSLNISMDRILQKTFLYEMGKLRSPKFQLGIELLETILFEKHEDQLKFTIDALRELGIQVEIDDFGTGRASIAILLQLMPDRIKIDQAIIRAVESDPKKIEMVHGIARMSHSVGANVTAEGVEDISLVEDLRKAGCDLFQGYAFCKPLAERDFFAWAKSREMQRFRHA